MTEKELKQIPNNVWMKYFKLKHDIECEYIYYFLINDESNNGFLTLKIYCSILTHIYIDVSEEDYDIICNYKNDLPLLENQLLLKKIINNVKCELDRIPFGDIADIGNVIGFVIGNQIKNTNNKSFTKNSFKSGLNHGFSLTDGTH